MKNLIAIALLQLSFTALATVCEDVPVGNNGNRVQSLSALTGKPYHTPGEAYLGENQVYEGAPCPAGKICIETITNNIISDDAERSPHEIRGHLAHGQVVVINKQTGLVESLEPLKFSSRARRGIPLLNQSRWTNICRRLKQEAGKRYSVQGTPEYSAYYATNSSGPCEYGDLAPNYLELYSYNSGCEYSGPNQEIVTASVSPLYNDYCAFSASAKQRAILSLNSGTTTRPGYWAQEGSNVQDGGAGTFARLAQLVGQVRQRLKCDPTPQDPRTRLAFSLVDQAAKFRECFTIDRSPSARRFDRRSATDSEIRLNLVDTRQNLTLTEDVPRAEPEGRRGRSRRRNTEVVPPITYILGRVSEDLPSNCTSVQTSESVETITCDNGPLAPVDPSANRNARLGLNAEGLSFVGDPVVIGISEPQKKITVRLVNGQIESLNLEQNYTYVSDYKKTCTPSAAEIAPVRTGTTGGAAIQQ